MHFDVKYGFKIDVFDSNLNTRSVHRIVHYTTLKKTKRNGALCLDNVALQTLSVSRYRVLIGVLTYNANRGVQQYRANYRHASLIFRALCTHPSPPVTCPVKM